jgi:hypothetical protein
MSIVKMVEAELSIESRLLITAPKSAAKSRPRSPTGTKFWIRTA